MKFAESEFVCNHPRTKDFLMQGGKFLRGVVNHLNAHKVIEGYLQTSLTKADNKLKKWPVKPRFSIMQPQTGTVDAKFKQRIDAFAAASRMQSIHLLSHRLAAPAGYAVPSFETPPVILAPGSVYRLSPTSLACVLEINSEFEKAKVIFLECHLSCKMHQFSKCWKSPKRNVPTWVEIASLGDDLISIAPRCLKPSHLRVKAHAACFRVLGSRTPEEHQACAVRVRDVFAQCVITSLKAEDAHLLSALVPVRRFWYVHSNGKDFDHSALKCKKCKGKSLSWAGSQMCRTRGLGMTCIFRVLSPRLKCTSCGSTWVAWDQYIQNQIPEDVVPIEKLDHIGNRFLEPAVTYLLCSTLKQTFHRGALKSKYSAVSIGRMA